MKSLAILGGKKIFNYKISTHNSIGIEEKKAVNKVMSSGALSGYFGSWSKGFYGGKYVQKFEESLSKYFNVKYAICVNSWTSGLIAAVGALDINPGDEIIVSPWTMSASAMAILHWNAIPVFADIENETFNLNPKDVEKKITKKTKAIMSIDIFGHSGPIKELKKIAKKYKLKIISDCAQSPGAKYEKKYAGTLTDIGGISLNYHKHINTGEGGVVFTNNKTYAERISLIRNHAEAVVEKKGVKNLQNLIGYNFRMGELEAAIGIQQLKKLKRITKQKQLIANILIKGLSDLKYLKVPVIKKNCSHVFYIFALKVFTNKIGIHRDKIFDALAAEGIPGLQKKYLNLSRLPIFTKKIAYGSKGFPWNLNSSTKKISYTKGICPKADELFDENYLGILLCSYDFKKKDALKIIEAFKKVWKNLDLLK